MLHAVSKVIENKELWRIFVLPRGQRLKIMQ